MKIYLLRHGLTACNAEKRYQGKTDAPLSPEGKGALVRADFSSETVYVTPLKRTAQTAAILFPQAKQIPISDLREMDFGVFEGRNYMEMADDPGYRAWVDANCETPCPGGEGKTEFSDRVCKAFAHLVEENLDKARLVIVAHGGTQMAIMERFARPHGDYYSWRAPNGGGYVLSADRWREEKVLELLATVCYANKEVSNP